MNTAIRAIPTRIAASGHKSTPIAHQKSGAISAMVRLRPLAMVRVRISTTEAHSSRHASTPPQQVGDEHLVHDDSH